MNTQNAIGNQFILKRTTVNDAAYTALISDVIIEYTALTAARTVTLPAVANVPVGKTYVIKDGAGTAGTNTITIDGSGAETIDGAATQTITVNYGELEIYNTGSAWRIKTGDIFLRKSGGTMTGNILFNNDTALQWKNSGGATRSILNYDSTNNVRLTNTQNDVFIASITGDLQISDGVGYFNDLDMWVTSATVNKISFTQLGNILNAGYLRVGSTSAPANTTAGDLTAVRLFISSTADITGVTTHAAAINVANDVSMTFRDATNTNNNSFKTGSDGTFLFDVGTGNSVKVKGGDSSGVEEFGYTDASFSFEWKANTLGRTTQNGGAVINEEGQDSDTRIEGDTNANLFFIDASTDRIGIGTNAPEEILHIDKSSGFTTIRFDAGTDEGFFYADNDFHFIVMGSRSATPLRMVYNGNQRLDFSSTENVFNDNAADIDTRIEGDTDANCFFLDASVDAIVMGGSSATNSKLTLAGSKGALALTDGITAPSTSAGYAQIYVDTSDGDLKVKFGDGTVKTIATDT